MKSLLLAALLVLCFNIPALAAPLPDLAALQISHPHLIVLGTDPASGEIVEGLDLGSIDTALLDAALNRPDLYRFEQFAVFSRENSCTQ